MIDRRRLPDLEIGIALSLEPRVDRRANELAYRPVAAFGDPPQPIGLRSLARAIAAFAR